MKTASIATLTIIRSGQHVLLGTKKKGAQIGAGKLNAPGGRMEEGEQAATCAAREVNEEVGVSIDRRHLQHIGVLESYAADELFQTVHVYYTERYFGEPCETASMVPEWVPVDPLPFERMHEGDRHWFPLAVCAHRFRFRVWYERPGEGYVRHQLENY